MSEITTIRRELPWLRSRARANLILGVAFGLAALGLFAYVRRSLANVVFRDGIQLLPTVGEFYSGSLTIGKLFVPYSEHLLPFYRTLLVASSAVLGLNMFVDPILMAVGSLLTAWVLYGAFRRSMAEVLTPGGVVLAFLPMLAICVSLAYPPQVFMAVQFQLASIIALFVGFLLYGAAACERSRARFLASGVLVVVYFALFAGGYFAGLVAGLIAVLAIRFALERKRPGGRDWALLALTLSCAAGYARWMVRGHLAGQSPSHKLLEVTMHPSRTVQFFLKGLSAALMDLHSFEGLSPRAAAMAEIGLGGLVLVFCCLALWLFWRSGMGGKTYLPIWLLAYPFGIMAAVCVGRSGRGASDWMMNEWYSFHLKFVPISVLWIVLFAAVESGRTSLAVAGASTRSGRTLRMESVMALAFLVVLASTWAYSNGAQWNRGPYVKQWFEARRIAMLYPETLTEPIEDVLLVSREEALVGQAILARNHLNVFRGPEIIKASGWYGDGWIGPTASVKLLPGKSGQLHLSARIPEKIFREIYSGDLDVEVLLGNMILATRHLSNPSFGDGSFSMDVNVPPGPMQSLEIRTSKSFVPANHRDYGQDQRELSIFVRKLSSP